MRNGQWVNCYILTSISYAFVLRDKMAQCGSLILIMSVTRNSLQYTEHYCVTCTNSNWQSLFQISCRGDQMHHRWPSLSLRNPAAAPPLSCALPLVGSSGQSDASPMTSVAGSSIAVRESSGRPSSRWLDRFPCLDDRGNRPSISDPICRLVGFWWILLAVSGLSLFCYSSDEICVVFEIDFGAPSRNLRRSTVHFGHRTEAENSRASLVLFSFVIYPWI